MQVSSGNQSNKVEFAKIIGNFIVSGFIFVFTVIEVMNIDHIHLDYLHILLQYFYL